MKPHASAGKQWIAGGIAGLLFAGISGTLWTQAQESRVHSALLPSEAVVQKQSVPSFQWKGKIFLPSAQKNSATSSAYSGTEQQKFQQPNHYRLSFVDPALWPATSQDFLLYPVNERFQCSDTIIQGTRQFSRMRAYGVNFSVLYDEISGSVISLPSGVCAEILIDTIIIALSHVKPLKTSGIPDTLIVAIHPVVNGNVDLTTILFADTLISDTSITGDTSYNQPSFGITFLISTPGGLTITTPDRFAVIVHFRGVRDKNGDGDSTSFILPLGRLDDPCNGQCLMYPAPYQSASLFRFSYPVASLCDQWFAAGDLYADCNGNGQLDSAGCEPFSFHFAIWAAVRINVLSQLDADVTTDPNEYYVCVGDTTTLTATTGFPSYTWTGPGIISTNNNIAQVYFANILANSDTQFVTVSASAGSCNLVDTAWFYIWKVPPVANLQIGSIDTTTFTVLFQNNSLDAVTCQYDWGDGSPPTTSCAPVVTHSFPQPPPGQSCASYPVTLTVTNPCGVDTAVLDLTLCVLGVADDRLEASRITILSLEGGVIQIGGLLEEEIVQVRVMDRTGKELVVMDASRIRQDILTLPLYGSVSAGEMVYIYLQNQNGDHLTVPVLLR